MLDHFFRSQHLIARVRGNPGVESLDAFAGHLVDCGYSRSQGARHLRAAAHLLHWLDGNRLPRPGTDAPTVDRFDRILRTAAAQDLPTCTRTGSCEVFAPSWH